MRWLYFLSFAVLIGSLGFRLVCLRGWEVPPRVEKRLYLLAGAGVVGAIEIGIVAFCLRCEDVLQLPLGKYVYGDLTPIAQGTRFGEAFIVMTLGFAYVAAVIYLAWLLERPRLLIAALAGSLVLLSGLSLSGHDAVDAGSSKWTELADWVHISAASLWLGGLLSLVVIWPVAAGLRREAFFRFSRVATVLVGLVLARGHLPGTRAGASPPRPVDAELRAGAAREDLARRGGGRLGGVPPFRRAAAARDCCPGHVDAGRAQPRGREHGRGRGAARRGDPRRLEAAAAAAVVGSGHPGGGASLSSSRSRSA